MSASSFAICREPLGTRLGKLRELQAERLEPGAHRLPVAPPPRDQVELGRDVAARHRRDRDAVRLEMVGMVVAAGVGVRDDDIGAVRLEQFEQPRRADVDRDVAERIGMVLELPLLHPGVAVAEANGMRHAQLAARDVELGEAGGGDGVRVVSGFARLHVTGPVTHLAVRAGHDDGLRALVAVAREDTTGAGGFVVRVGVDGHERVRSRHRASFSPHCHLSPSKASSNRGCTCARLARSTMSSTRWIGAGLGDDDVQVAATRLEPLRDREQHADTRTVEVGRAAEVDDVPVRVAHQLLLEHAAPGPRRSTCRSRR